ASATRSGTQPLGPRDTSSSDSAYALRRSTDTVCSIHRVPLPVNSTAQLEVPWLASTTSTPEYAQCCSPLSNRLLRSRLNGTMSKVGMVAPVVNTPASVASLLPDSLNLADKTSLVFHGRIRSYLSSTIRCVSSSPIPSSDTVTRSPTPNRSIVCPEITDRSATVTSYEYDGLDRLARVAFAIDSIVKGDVPDLKS